MGKLILVTGGARSGKSSFAERYIKEIGKNVAYIATSQVYDEEMAFRVKLHKQRRPAEWKTFESPFDAHEIIAKHGHEYDAILFDCMTIYISNILCSQENIDDFDGIYEKVSSQVEKLIAAVKQVKATVVFVTNEVGSGIVPDNRLSREYRDLAGLSNQLLAKAADKVFLVVSGIPVDIKKLEAPLQDN